jgi:hypothetical protein
MSKMIRPEMSVVRFKEADVIVASGLTMTWSNFGDGTAKNGVVTFNGTDYTISDTTAISNLYNDMGVKRTAGLENRDGTVDKSINTVLNLELSGDGVSSKAWNTTYVYDANAIWNNGSTDIRGVFKRQ